VTPVDKGTNARNWLAHYWDDHIRDWLAGNDALLDPLPRWFDSYRGTGSGTVTREAFAEPWIGPLLGTPRLVVLGLNPGRADLAFQGRAGTFAREIAERSGFTEWAASAPYSRPPWTAVKGRNRYHDQRAMFACRFYEEPDLTAGDVLAMELYPWHSTRVTGAMHAPRDVLDRFVWQPLAELGVTEVFAFGKPWLRVARSLGLTLECHLGPGGQPWSSTVASRTVLVYRLPSHQRLIISWQAGYAGPPGEADTERLRAIVPP
jgi:hypothetical protein